MGPLGNPPPYISLPLNPKLPRDHLHGRGRQIPKTPGLLGRSEGATIHLSIAWL